MSEARPPGCTYLAQGTGKSQARHSAALGALTGHIATNLCRTLSTASAICAPTSTFAQTLTQLSFPACISCYF